MGLAGLTLSLTGCATTRGGSFTPSTYAPQVLASFPESGIQTLPREGSITFQARGEDFDSLDLEWEWMLDGSLQAFGSVDSAHFEEAWTLDWDESLAGHMHDVHFIVRDRDGNSTELFWPVQVP